MNNQKVGLIILDGWGIGDKSKSDAIYNANTPIMDGLLANYPHAQLITCGEAVGLPDGQMGNSEVGHLNIGAGRIVYQELTRINKSIRDGEFFELEKLKNCFSNAKKTGKKVHLMGLVSEGGVHSSQAHLEALLTMAHSYELKNVWIHAFTDGRDCDPKSGLAYFERLEKHVQQTTGTIATITGRYYAMDRDNRWERIKVAYDAMVNGIGKNLSSITEAFTTSYEAGITDEFIEPFVFDAANAPGKIENGDTVISFNFRTDRPREISAALTQQAFPEHNMRPLVVDYYTMTNYDSRFKKVQVLFEKDNLKNTLGEVLAKMGRTQIRIAETEKYPHVTFFFNGGREKEFEGESRILVNSPKVATYDLQPEMSALEVKNKIVAAIEENCPDFFCLNFANPDMVGHTGNYEAITKAVETVDSCLGEIVAAAQAINLELIVIADHGNADVAFNPDGSPNTAHSLNPVPIVLVTEKTDLHISNGILADVAPTILSRMRLAAPIEMTGKSLL
jgi:2,3-bisphosphoglycerate-independent phosphoglycerate mutase